MGAAAVAISVGVAVGWGGKDDVANDIGRWKGPVTVSTPTPRAQADGGTDRA